MKKILTGALLVLLLIGLAGCQKSNGWEAVDFDSVEGVGQFESYDQLKDYLDSYYEEDTLYYRTMDSNSAALESDIMTTTTAQSDSTDDVNYSETNNQVNGVSEADRILTDGYYIYVLSDNGFYIVDANTLEFVYVFTNDYGYAYGLYKYGDSVVVLMHEYYYINYMIEDETTTVTSGASDSDTDGSSYVYLNNYGTRVIVFDVSDKENVTVTRNLFFERSYLNDSRMIDDVCYLMMENYAGRYGYDEDDYFPVFYDDAASDKAIDLPIDHIYYMPGNNYYISYMLLATFSVDNDEQADVNAYLGSSSDLYMSLDNLYVVCYRYSYTQVFLTDASNDETVFSNWYFQYWTYVIRFGVEDGKLEYEAVAKINGYPLNQFSMDEYDGYFRIATTGYVYSEDYSTSTITNQLAIFDATTEGEIEPVSVLTGLGKPNERIYAVRYSGNIAYVVTFVNTDPLYKLDLSDPENPEIVDELYEEGVSDYLHEIGDNLLLGIGRQAVTENGFTHFTGVKVALYDVSGDETINLETYFVEGDYSYSPVTYDHKAFVSYEPEGADYMYVTIPVYEYYSDWYASLQSVYVFKVYYAGDLEFITRLTHMDDTSHTYWYHYDSIERTVMIENYIYTVSYNQIRKYDMASGFTLDVTNYFHSEDGQYYPYYGFYD